MGFVYVSKKPNSVVEVYNAISHTSIQYTCTVLLKTKLISNDNILIQIIGKE